MALRIDFRPEKPDLPLILATQNYKEIWERDGSRIQKVFFNLTGLHFKQRHITAIIVPGDESSSGMTGVHMRLGADQYPHDKKAVALIHELGHRLLGGNKVWTELDHRANKYYEHRRLDLFLYDAYCDLYGKDIANQVVETEKKDALFYGKAWDWALQFSRKERQQKFRQLIKRKQEKSS